MPVIAATKTEVLFDGQKLDGLKGFQYKRVIQRQDVDTIGSKERRTLVFGKELIKGVAIFHSNSPVLNEWMNSEKPFQIVLQTTLDPYGVNPGNTKKLTFDECRIEESEFSMDANGYGLTTYTWTATRMREE